MYTLRELFYQVSENAATPPELAKAIRSANELILEPLRTDAASFTVIEDAWAGYGSESLYTGFAWGFRTAVSLLTGEI